MTDVLSLAFFLTALVVNGTVGKALVVRIENQSLFSRCPNSVRKQISESRIFLGSHRARKSNASVPLQNIRGKKIPKDLMWINIY